MIVLLRTAQLYVNIFMPALPVSTVECLSSSVVCGDCLQALYSCPPVLLPSTIQAAFMYSLQTKFLQNQVTGKNFNEQTVKLLIKHSTVDLENVFVSDAAFFPPQGIIWPEVITGLLVNILNVVLNYILLHPLQMGVV